MFINMYENLLKKSIEFTFDMHFIFLVQKAQKPMFEYYNFQKLKFMNNLIQVKKIIFIYKIEKKYIGFALIYDCKQGTVSYDTKRSE